MEESGRSAVKRTLPLIGLADAGKIGCFDRSGFYSRPEATCPFVQERCEHCKLGFDGLYH